jgi:hypothetical protein
VGRQVKRGEKGVRVTTFIPIERTDETTGEKKRSGSRPWAATVFHISQTKAMDEPQAEGGAA